MATDTRIHLLTGSDDSTLKEQALEIVKKLSPSGDWGTEIYDGWVETIEEALTVLGKVMEALQTPAFLSDHKLIWLKNVTFLSDTSIAKNGEVLSKIETLLDILEKGLSAGITLLISALQVDKRRTFYKKLEKLSIVKTFDLPTVSKRDWESTTADMVENWFRQKGKQIDSKVADQLVALCGSDPKLLRNEAEKVILYCGDKQPITVSDVEEIVSSGREETIWTWCDAVIESHTERAIQLLRKLEFQQENAVGLMVNLASHARLALECRVLLDKKWLRLQGSFSAKWSPEAESVLLRGHEAKSPAPFRVARVGTQAAKRSLPHWIEFLEKVYAAYLSFFSTNINPYRQLELLILKLNSSII